MDVTSLVEVWIEIQRTVQIYVIVNVTSLVEVWIEIPITYKTSGGEKRHFPCGSVD